MARASLTPRETQIMQILWNLRSGTAEEIRRALPENLHDSTVRTLLRILEHKGFVEHAAHGRIYVYRPTVARAAAERSAVRTLLRRFFGGSAEALVLRLIEDEQLTPEQLDQLGRRPRARRGRGEKGGEP